MIFNTFANYDIAPNSSSDFTHWPPCPRNQLQPYCLTSNSNRRSRRLLCVNCITIFDLIFLLIWGMPILHCFLQPCYIIMADQAHFGNVSSSAVHFYCFMSILIVAHQWTYFPFILFNHIHSNWLTDDTCLGRGQWSSYTYIYKYYKALRYLR